MAEATTYQPIIGEKTRSRDDLKAVLEEMSRLHLENKQSQERIECMDKDIDARLSNIDAILARLATA
jgi:hypothetical protein